MDSLSAVSATKGSHGTLKLKSLIYVFAERSETSPHSHCYLLTIKIRLTTTTCQYPNQKTASITAVKI